MGKQNFVFRIGKNVTIIEINLIFVSCMRVTNWTKNCSIQEIGYITRILSNKHSLRSSETHLILVNIVYWS